MTLHRTMPRVAVVDDLDVVKVGLTQILRRAGAVIVELPPSVAVERADLGPVDLLVLGPELRRPAAELVARLHGAGYGGRTLALVRGIDLGVVHSLVAAGTDGVALLSTSEAELLAVVERVLAGERVVADLAAHLLAPSLQTTDVRSPLTSREREVLALLATNRTLAEIGTELFVSVGTVKRHTAHIYGKLGVRARRDAVERAFAGRMLDVVTR